MNATVVLPPPVRTTCPYCGVGCGIVARADGLGGAGIEGDVAHPANFGRLCSKGSALGETLALDNRVLHPMMRGTDGLLARTDWTNALDSVAAGFRRTVETHGPDAAAFYLSGQLLTEDYYVANKLMKGFIGSGHVDTNSRLCMASSVAGHRRAFGSDTVPGCYADLESADLLVLVGSNAAWCHPVLFQRMQQAKSKRGSIIVNIDVRGTATGDSADLQLILKPGTDAALFSGLLVYLADKGFVDRPYLDAHTEGYDEALWRARSIAANVTATARATGLDAADVAHFFDLWGRTRRVVTLHSQGVNQSAQGTDKVNAIVNCHLATGRIGREGMGPLSLTGQPNAMGGREVGGLANILAAHMGFSVPELDRVQRFWKAPRMAAGPGLKAVEMFEAIASGRIKALWVMGTNPAVSLPDADRVRRALSHLDLFVVSENTVANDTVKAGAHVVLPAAAWGEKDGTVTNSERRISRQRAFLPLPGEAKPDWWIVAQVARRIGFSDAFSYASAAAIFREHAALSAFENEGTRDFDIGGLAGLTDAGFDGLEPVQWPVRAASPEPAEHTGDFLANAAENIVGTARLFGDGQFFTPSRKARLIAIDPPALHALPGREHPLVLNTGRVRDQWHTMTRTGLSPRLGVHTPEPFVAIHPVDAARFDVTDRGFARLTSPYGTATLRVAVTPTQAPGSVFVPFHWTDETSVGGRIGALVHPVTDPVSGQPDAKATPVAVAPVRFAVQGFFLAKRAIALPGCGFLAHARLPGGTLTTFATDRPAAALVAFGRAMVADASPAIDVDDAARGVRRLVWLGGADAKAAACERLVLFLNDGDTAPDWHRVAELFAQDELSALERLALVAGLSAEGMADNGPTVCACFGVGRSAICNAIVAGARSAEAIGATLRAGTNCGSCIPELKRLLTESAAPMAPETAGPDHGHPEYARSAEAAA